MLEKKSHEEGEKVKEINEKKAQMQKDKILMADYQRKAAEISKNIAAMTTRLKAIEQPNNLLQLLQIKELK